MKQKVLKSSLKLETEQVLQIREQRYFSEAFKRQKVEDLLSKRTSVQQTCDLYGVSRTSVYKWIYLYSPHHSQKSRQVVEMESESNKTEFFQNRVAEMERIVGQKQLEIDFLNQLLLIASEELGFDVKKNFSTAPLNGIAAIKTFGQKGNKRVTK
jgi:transposase